MIQIAICDDIPTERDQFRSLLHSFSDMEESFCFELTEYASGEALLIDLEEDERFDLIVLDIYMERLNGMETAWQIRKNGVDTPLVFLTASKDFALESYDVNAAGYLLKPVKLEKLAVLLKRLLTPPEKPRICVQSGRRRRYLFLEEIIYAESENHNIRIHLRSGETIGCAEKLGDLEQRLDGRFLRCHQSYLVNMNYVADVEEDFVLKDGRRIPIRTRQRRDIADAYYRFFVKDTLAP